MIGNFFKMVDDLTPKTINTKHQSRNRVERPKLKWSDDVGADIKIPRTKSRRPKAEDRKG
jgi:hypothetical protein